MVMLMEDRPCWVEFELRAVEDRKATEEKGHMVYRDVPFAKVTPPGGNLVVEKRAEAWLEDKRRSNDPHLRHYEESYRAFIDGLEAPVDGTRIQDWPAVTPAQVKTLQGAGVRAVEDLAAANEELLGRIGMGARALKQKAEAWIASATDTGRAAEELAALRTRTAEQAETIASLEKKVEGLQSALQDNKPKRGRPRKQESED